MNFDIDPAFLTDVTVTKTYTPHQNKTDLTAEELLDVIKYSHTITSHGSDDHPEFAQLRNQLEAEGFIACERNWWNGDRVLQPFFLNGVPFFPDDQFPCAGAMSGHLKFKHKYGASG